MDVTDLQEQAGTQETWALPLLSLQQIIYFLMVYPGPLHGNNNS